MTQVTATRALGLWPAVWKLLRLRALITLRGLSRAKTGSKVGMAIGAVFLLGLLVLLFVMSTVLLRFLRSPQLAELVPQVESFIASVPVLVVGAGFLVILATSFGVLLQALYLAGDMDFLLSAPIPVRAVFVSKLLQAILPNLAVLCLAAVPLLFGLGASGGYNILYYPLVVLMLVAVALAGAAVASLVVMGVARIFPARRVAEVLGFVGALVSLVCSQSGQFARFGKVSAGQVSSALTWAVGMDVPWSPLAWAGRGLVGVGEGRWLAGAGLSVLALGSAGLVFAAALAVAERLYYSGWGGMQTVQRRKKVVRRSHRTSARPLAATGHLVPRPVAAIIVKDWTVLRRDLRNLSQLVTPLIMGVVYTLMLLRGRGEALADPGGAPGWLMQAAQSALAYGSIGISLFVGWTLLSRLAAMSFSQEGKSYWLLKSAPVSAARLLAAKFLVAYLPALAVSWGFLGALTLLGAGATLLWFSPAVVALCLAAACGIYLAFGVGGARFDWEDPRQMISGRAGCVGVLATGAAMLAGLALFAAPQIGLPLLGWPAPAAQLVGLLLGGACCLACALLPLRFVRSRVPRLGEE